MNKKIIEYDKRIGLNYNSEIICKKCNNKTKHYWKGICLLCIETSKQ
jgi:NMD protein affecting ribosome stability and mRNA decay